MALVWHGMTHLSPSSGEDQHLLHAVGALHCLVDDALEVQSLPAALTLVRGEHPLAVRVLVITAVDPLCLCSMIQLLAIRFFYI